MQNFYVEIYTEIFIEKELNELIEFYESPLGKKMLTKMPDLKNKIEKYVAELEKKYKK